MKCSFYLLKIIIGSSYLTVQTGTKAHSDKGTKCKKEYKIKHLSIIAHSIFSVPLLHFTYLVSVYKLPFFVFVIPEVFNRVSRIY